MTTASEIQQLALDVFENKLDYKDNDYIVILNILKESYMKVKGILNEVGSVKEVDTDSDEAEAETDDEYFLRTHRYYDSDEDSDDESYTGSYLSPY
tara:strand:- start:385 stop:672 length:288 start_codon:yes stop_codon:yes gene_type:complete